MGLLIRYDRQGSDFRFRFTKPRDQTARYLMKHVSVMTYLNGFEF